MIDLKRDSDSLKYLIWSIDCKKMKEFFYWAIWKNEILWISLKNFRGHSNNMSHFFGSILILTPFIAWHFDFNVIQLETRPLEQAWATSGPRATYGPPSTLMWPASYIWIFLNRYIAHKTSRKTWNQFTWTCTGPRIPKLSLMWPAKPKSCPPLP